MRGDLRRSADVLADDGVTKQFRRDARHRGSRAGEETGLLEAKLSEIRASESGARFRRVARAEDESSSIRVVSPAFLTCSAARRLNDLISQIAKVETDRTLLLASRPESSPQAMALAHARA